MVSIQIYSIGTDMTKSPVFLTAETISDFDPLIESL